jgi:hypothetical protein
VYVVVTEMASRTHRAQLEVLVVDEDEVVAEAAATDEFDRLGRSTWATERRDGG